MWLYDLCPYIGCVTGVCLICCICGIICMMWHVGVWCMVYIVCVMCGMYIVFAVVYVCMVYWDSVYVGYLCFYGICFLLYGRYARHICIVAWYVGVLFVWGVWRASACCLSCVCIIYLCGCIGQVNRVTDTRQTLYADPSYPAWHTSHTG